MTSALVTVQCVTANCNSKINAVHKINNKLGYGVMAKRIATSSQGWNQTHNGTASKADFDE